MGDATGLVHRIHRLRERAAARGAHRVQLAVRYARMLKCLAEIVNDLPKTKLERSCNVLVKDLQP